MRVGDKYRVLGNTEELNELLAILQAELEEREKYEANLENRIVGHEDLQEELEEQEEDEIVSRIRC